MVAAALLILGAIAIWIGTSHLRNWKQLGRRSWEQERRIGGAIWGTQPSQRYLAWQVRIGGYAAVFVGTLLIVASIAMMSANFF